MRARELRNKDLRDFDRHANSETIRPVQPKISSGKEIEMPRWRVSLPAHGIFVYLQNISATLGVGCQKCYAKSPKRWVLNSLQTKIWIFLFLTISHSLCGNSMLLEQAKLQVVKFVCIHINLLGVLLNKIQAGERWRAKTSLQIKSLYQESKLAKKSETNQ